MTKKNLPHSAHNHKSCVGVHVLTFKRLCVCVCVFPIITSWWGSNCALLMCAPIDTCELRLSLSVCPHLWPSFNATRICSLVVVRASTRRSLLHPPPPPCSPPPPPDTHRGPRTVGLAGRIPGRVILLWCNVNHIARDFQPAKAETHAACLTPPTPKTAARQHHRPKKSRVHVLAGGLTALT